MHEDYAQVETPEGRRLKRGYFVTEEELVERDVLNKLQPVILERRKMGVNTVSLAGILYDSTKGIHHYEVGVQEKGGAIVIKASKNDILSAVDAYLSTIDALGQEMNNKGLVTRLRGFFYKISGLNAETNI